MSRLNIDDTPANAVLKLVDEDRPAAAACIAMVKAVETADPKAAFGPFTPLMILDQFAIYGASIAVFYVRVCGGDPVKALAVLHAARLKLITAEELKRAIAGRGPRLDAEMVLDLVRSRIEGFGREGT
jgi:hypothetical protein